IGETQFLCSLTVQQALSAHGWALCEWSDSTPTYVLWLQRWCHQMEMLSADLSIEMGKDQAARLIRRFKTYLTLAQNQTVRRIILRAQHV
ncbi:MAG: hypothetical protein EBU93_06110, partial [Chlamydiae bacterium]|nr:hypothetical protein [Chlamydiota bacterium]